MKIAVTGKGGAGKTTVAGVVARLLARRGHDVVAVDGDPNPHLGITVGLPRSTVEEMQPILNGLLASGYRHDDPPIDPDELLERYGTTGPDGIRVVATGRIERPSETCMCCGSHRTTQAFFGGLADQSRVVIADLGAGLNELVWAKPGPHDLLLVVADPSVKAIDIARRSRGLARSMGVQALWGVANRSTDMDHPQRLARAVGIDVLRVPEDDSVARAAHLGTSPFDADPSSPAIVALAQLADRLGEQAPGGGHVSGVHAPGSG